MTTKYPTIKVAGDQGLLVTFGATYGKRTSRAVTAFDSEARRSSPEGVLEFVPTIRSVLVRFDPFLVSFQELDDWCAGLLESRDWYESGPPPEQKTWEFPAVYGGSAGPEIEEVADLAGMSCKCLIELHTSVALEVLCLGFSPGLAYLAELPSEFAVPRRKSYDSTAPPGSLLVANRQTVLPGTSIPTGWRRIGTTPVRTFRPTVKYPFLLSPGDSVKFRAVSEGEARRLDDDALWRERLFERS